MKYSYGITDNQNQFRIWQSGLNGTDRPLEAWHSSIYMDSMNKFQILQVLLVVRIILVMSEMLFPSVYIFTGSAQEMLHNVLKTNLLN